MGLKLVSFTVCPFVQRAVLMLRHKKVDFDIEYIDLRDKPEWFLKASPRGKVPIVMLDDGNVLFESQAICEYLEEVYPEPALHPSDPVGRARDRAWFGMAGEDLFVPLWKIESASDEEALEAAVNTTRSMLARVEDGLEGRDWLSGDGSRFGMADVGVSSAATRVDYLKRRFDLNLVGELPRLAAWIERMLGVEAMKQAIPDVWEEDFLKAMERYGSVLLKR